MMNSQISPAEAAQHLLNRRRARADVVPYAGYIDVPGRPVSDDPSCELFHPVETNLAAHHKLILRTAVRTALRPYGRAMLLFPPGSAKTTYGSVVYPSHYLGEEPGRRLILTSYAQPLAEKMGRRTRSIIRQPRYRSIFKTGLSRDSQAAAQFVLENGGEYMASGLMGGITGNRADGALIDDPIKGREDAESEIVREKTWDAYNDDLLTRLRPGGWLMLTQTRWHENDLAGRILPDGWSGDSGMFVGRDGLDWEILCVQARCETTTDPLGRKIGEYLWPQWFDAKHWATHESDPRKWNSLFQQRPQPIEGAFFSAADLLGPDNKPIDCPQRVDAVFAVIDSAMKDGKSHDGIAAMFFALSRLNLPINPPLAVLDWDLQQIKGAFLSEWLPSVFVRLEQYAKECGAFKGSLGVFVEDKSSGTILIQQAQHPSWVTAHPNWIVRPIESKLTAQGKKQRAANASGHVKAGQVKWTRRAYERVCTFKGVTKNHAWGQVLKFSPDSKDTDPDDCLDTKTYGVALALGNSKGF